METKLTLRLDKLVIEKAKSYANSHHISLSRMIESYLDSMTKKDTAVIEITPLVKSLSGVIHPEKESDYSKDIQII
ncbi:MAG: DUF6364 family protein [Bacteroidia bacterium]|nr:DUF6364 family protein [Bacteroidia bacterium]